MVAIVLMFYFNVDITLKASAQIESSDIQELWNLPTYQEYISKKEYLRPDSKLEINAVNYVNYSNIENIENYLEEKQSAILSKETGFAEYEFEISEAGFYEIFLLGANVEGKGGTIERKIYIDGKVPFQEANSVVIKRNWVDDGEITLDSAGDENAPLQKEVYAWQTTPLADTSGLNEGNLKFYLTEGKHTIRIESVREKYVLGKIILKGETTLPNYEEIKVEYEKNGYSTVDECVTIQAEKNALKSDKNLSATYDKASVCVTPYSSTNIKINIIGSNWNTSGQFLSWDFTPKKSGLYKIAVCYRQDGSDGRYVSRRLKINGEVPFEEAEAIRFPYTKDWVVDYLSNEKEDFLFYFEAGKKSTISLEVTLGDMTELIRKANNVLNSLQNDYNSILTITGAEIDAFRDYKFDKLIPDVLKDFSIQAKALTEIYDKLYEITGQHSQSTAVLKELVYDLKIMSHKPKKIANRLSNFKSNLGTYASFVLNCQQQPLSLDWISFTGNDDKTPILNNNIFKKSWHVISQFLYSFTKDYNYSSDFENGKEAITVWVGSGTIGGRDQAQIVRRMINDTFVTQKNIAVNLQLVTTSSLLSATLADVGPDVALQVDGASPMNYALRNAVIDLKQFSDFEEISKRFVDESMVPYSFDGKCYALPDTFSFPMMFVRLDIFDELNLDVPQTWEELLEVIPVINKKGMEIGVPHDFATYAMLMYQNGYDIYSEDALKTNMANKELLPVFEGFTELFTDYGLPLSYDFVNRFRNGEMPIAIADFTIYNQLSVFAPEIKGKWSFFAIPGTKDSNSDINRSVASVGTGSIIMSNSRNKRASWEFLKWWTEESSQYRFATELEGLLGVSARYSTANINAFSMLNWSPFELESILKQRAFAKGIPEVPGAYMTARYFNFAFLAVVNSGEEPAEEIRYYSNLINEELKEKQKEFGLNS